MSSRAVLVLLFVAVGAAIGLIAAGVPGATSARHVVVYTSADSDLALPLFKRFSAESGIEIVPRTDSESTKSAGLAERLMQMKGHPDGDVFWNSELSFTQLLASEGALQAYAAPNAARIPAEFKDPDLLWTGFGCRARVLLYNTGLVKRADVPATLEGLADPRWKNRGCIAKPLFGTTRSHLVSLVIHLGEERAFKMFHAWRENGVTIVESNSDVRERVAEGHFALGLTDSDDAYAGIEHKKPVDFIVPDQATDWRGAYLIPNTVSILKNCPNPDAAKIFVDWLLKPETEAWLAGQESRQIPVRPVGAELPEALRNLNAVSVDYKKLAAQVLPMGERIYRILSGEE